LSSTEPASDEESGSDGAAALEGTLTADPAALPLRETAPDAELLTVGERVLEAVDAHLTPPADGLGLAGGGSPLREEEVGIDAEAVGVLLPTALSLAVSAVGGDEGGET
jgi:hypothetical protein